MSVGKATCQRRSPEKPPADSLPHFPSNALPMHLFLHVLTGLAGLGPGAGPWLSEPAIAHALNETA